MKIAVINLSGNTGKSTISKSLLAPRIEGAEIFTVESANADGMEDNLFKSKQFNKVIQSVGAFDSCIVDIGSSENAADFLFSMNQQKGCHTEFDFFLVPIAESAKPADSIKTIHALSELGIKKDRIKTVFNKVENDDDLTEVFKPIYDFHKETKSFTLCDKKPIYKNELFPLLIQHKTSIKAILEDQTDYRAMLKAEKDFKKRLDIMEVIGLRRLAEGVKAELDDTFKSLVSA